MSIFYQNGNSDMSDPLQRAQILEIRDKILGKHFLGHSRKA